MNTNRTAPTDKYNLTHRWFNVYSVTNGGVTGTRTTVRRVRGLETARAEAYLLAGEGHTNIQILSDSWDPATNGHYTEWIGTGR